MLPLTWCSCFPLFDSDFRERTYHFTSHVAWRNRIQSRLIQKSDPSSLKLRLYHGFDPLFRLCWLDCVWQRLIQIANADRCCYGVSHESCSLSSIVLVWWWICGCSKCGLPINSTSVARCSLSLSHSQWMKFRTPRRDSSSHAARKASSWRCCFNSSLDTGIKRLGASQRVNPGISAPAGDRVITSLRAVDYFADLARR